MKLIKLITLLILGIAFNASAQLNFGNTPLPSGLGNASNWNLIENSSDDFNYTFNEQSSRSNFGPGNKWYNFFHNPWDGPGTTYWKYNHVSVNGSNLVLRASRWAANTQPQPITIYPNKMGRPLDGVNAGCITSNTKVLYPVYVEARVSVADIVLASDVWLLSPSDEQEIDIIECYGGNEQGNTFFSEFIHLSHHSFVRTPFTDYQPKDLNSWWPKSGVSDWGSYHWNGGNRRYVTIGVNWIDPFHFEYYIDGNLERVLYRDAVATKRNGSWVYQVPGMNAAGNLLFGSDEFQLMTQPATSANYNFNTLKTASDNNTVSIIDPYFFQKGFGMNQEMDIIINIESQNWHVLANRTPTTAQLNDPARNKMLVDWIRVYKPNGGSSNIAVTGVNLTPATLTLAPGATGNLTGAVTPSNATVKTMTFTSNNTSVATVTQSGVVTAVSVGTAVITANTTDGDFTDTSSITVSTNNPPPPSGNVIVIQAESFVNTGGTYNDSSSGGPGLGVNATASDINYVNSGDWVEYTINVSTAGNYAIEYNISSPSDNAQIQMTAGGATQTTNVPNNGSWTNYGALDGGSINLSSGSQTIRITASGSDLWQWNLEKITLTLRDTGGGNPPPSGSDEFYIVNRSSGQKLISPNNTSGGAINLTGAGSTSTYARWTKVASTGGYFYFKNVGSGMYIRPTTNQANSPIIQRPTSFSGSWTQWQEVTTSGGYFRLDNRAGDNLTASGGNAVNATQTNNAAQWIYQSAGTARSVDGIGKEEALASKILLYPNPAQNVINFTGATINSVKIYSLRGREILNSSSLKGNSVNISSLENGIYIAKIKTDEGVNAIKRIVINK